MADGTAGTGETKMTKQLGKALSIIAHHHAREYFMHADVEAFHAPSECHALVSRNEARRARKARRHAKAVSGMTRAQFRRALRNVPQRALERATGAIIARQYPFL